uniref:uncharacterized protein n=1 Tax=Pristiophorus japonicus TaxID=55135 RepID=UPI00398E995F
MIRGAISGFTNMCPADPTETRRAKNAAITAEPSRMFKTRHHMFAQAAVPPVHFEQSGKIEEQERRQRARRFSATAAEALIKAIERRWSALHPTEGRRPVPRVLLRIWREIAQEVSARDTVPRTATQCRKKFNDFTRVTMAKLAHNRREQQRTGGGEPDLQDLTEVEQRVSALMGTTVRAVTSAAVEPPMGSDDDQPEVQQPASEPLTSGNGGDDEGEDDSMLIKQETPLVPPNGDTTPVEELKFEGFEDSETPGPIGLQQRPAGEEALRPAPQWVSRPRSPAERQADVELDLVAMTREITQMHHDLMGVLGRVPQSNDALAESVAEATSSIARASPESNEPILAHSQREMGSVSDSGVPEGMVHAMVDVAAAIASQAQATRELRDVMLSVIAGMNSQTAAFQSQCNAMQSLTAVILSVFPTVRRGSDGAEAGQQFVLTRCADSPPRVSGSRPVKVEGAQDDSILAPTTATPPLHVLQSTSKPSQTAVADSDAMESAPGLPRSRAGPGPPARLSVLSAPQQPSSSVAEGTEATLRRSTRCGRGCKGEGWEMPGKV